jgi:hypothetical protein
VEECKETSIHGLWGISYVCANRRELAYRLGWKAIPLALEDFDSNYIAISLACENDMYVSDLREHVRGGGRHVDRLGRILRTPMPYA